LQSRQFVPQFDFYAFTSARQQPDHVSHYGHETLA